MQLTFDPLKDATNRAKHGVTLGMAADLEWDTLVCKTDARRDYGEHHQFEKSEQPRGEAL
jgi:uncharacterized protein